MSHKLEWGRWNLWKKDCWAFQVFFPTIRWKGYSRELMVDLDTALRISFTERGGGFMVLGFGVGFTRSPNAYRGFRNEGMCHHGVSLKRTCGACRAMEIERKERKRPRSQAIEGGE